MRIGRTPRFRVGNGIIAIGIITLLIALSIYLPISCYPVNKALLNLLERRLDAEIACRSLKIYLWRSIAARGVEAFGKGGFALKADNAVIDYDLISLVTGRLHVKCGLEDARFFKSGSIINSLTDLLHIQPIGNITFKSVQGHFYVGRHDTVTKDLTFLSDKIKIFANAVTDRDDNITGFILFLLNDEIAAEIPAEIGSALLHEEDGPWSSLYVGVMGNYQRPSLRIITERFRMNISSKS